MAIVPLDDAGQLKQMVFDSRAGTQRIKNAGLLQDLFFDQFGVPVCCVNEADEWFPFLVSQPAP